MIHSAVEKYREAMHCHKIKQYSYSRKKQVFTVGTLKVEQPQLDEVHNSKEMENESTTADAIDSNMKADLNDSNQQIANTLELGDAYKLAVNNRGRKLSGNLLEADDDLFC
ncbi:hypothetical protein Droror1_Dr00025448 [Drosera rotundifolia]